MEMRLLSWRARSRSHTNLRFVVLLSWLRTSFVGGFTTDECCYPQALFPAMTCEDGSAATPCCSYSACSFGNPCCGCDKGCRSLFVPSYCGEDLMPRALGAYCFLVNLTDEDWSPCPWLSHGPENISWGINDTLNLSRRPNVSRTLDSSGLVNLTSNQTSNTSDASNSSSHHGQIIRMTTVSEVSNGSYGVMSVNGTLIDFLYIFPTVVDLTGIDFGGNPFSATQIFRILISEDGRLWSNAGIYHTDQQQVRVDKGTYRARLVRLLWTGGHGPVTISLLGCLPDPNEIDESPEHIVLHFGVHWSLVLLALLTLIFCCLSCRTSCIQARCLRRPSVLWPRWQAAELECATVAPLLEVAYRQAQGEGEARPSPPIIS